MPETDNVTPAGANAAREATPAALGQDSVPRERELEVIRFHWEKWQSESRSYWRRILICTVTLSLILLHMHGGLHVKVAETELKDPERARWPLIIFGSFLLMHVGFCLIDLMRHRVPDRYETFVHNNRLKGYDIGRLGQRVYYLQLAVYLLLFGGGLLLAAAGIGWRAPESEPATKPSTDSQANQSREVAPSTSRPPETRRIILKAPPADTRSRASTGPVPRTR